MLGTHGSFWMSLLQIVVTTLHRDYMSLSNFPRKLWLQEDSNGASLIFKPLEPNTVLYIQTEAKLTVDFNDWMKEKEYNASAFSLKSRCIADAQGLGVPSQAQWFVFFLFVFFFFILLSPQAIFIYTVHWAVFLLPKKHDLYFTSQVQGLPDQNHEIW